MEGAGNVADLFESRAQQLTDTRQSGRGGVISNLVRDRGDLKGRCRERLADRIVELASNLGAFSLFGVDDFRAELSHPLAAGGETVEHLVDGRRQMGELAVRDNGSRDSLGKPPLGNQLRNSLESVDRAKREPHQGKIHDRPDNQSPNDDVYVGQWSGQEMSGCE